MGHLYHGYVSHNQRVSPAAPSQDSNHKRGHCCDLNVLVSTYFIRQRVTYSAQWIGLRENLQETMDFPIKYGVFL